MRKIRFSKTANQPRGRKQTGRQRRRSLVEALEFRALLSAAPFSNSALASVGDVFYIDMENHNLTAPTGTNPQQIAGNPAAPYINELIDAKDHPGNPAAAQTAYASNYLNVGHDTSTPLHPSEPNYVWQESGQSLAVNANDGDPYGSTNNINSAANLSGLLQTAGIDWQSYQEDADLTSNGSPIAQNIVPLQSNSGTSTGSPPPYTNPYNNSHLFAYAAKHDGQLFFTDTNGSTAASANLSPSNPEVSHYEPLTSLQNDLNSNLVGRYNLITPDLYNDMHTSLPGSANFTYNGVTYNAANPLSGTDQEAIAQGDNFLSKIIPAIMASTAYKNNGMIVIWTDETEPTSPPPTGNTSQFTLTEIVISPLVKPNVNGNAYNSTLTYTHSSDLKTMQELFLGRSSGFLGDANTPGTNDLTDLFANAITSTGAVSISATEGTTFSSTAVATFTDSDATAVAGDFTATINWGDGTSSTGTVTGSAGTLSVGGSHLYADELASGTASVVFTQTTPSTATGTATGTANVADADIFASLAASVGATEGKTFSGAVATFTNDVGYPGNTASDFTATIDWGDGSSSSVGTVSGSAGNFTVSGSHLYSDELTGGTITVVLNDDAPNSATETVTGPATVADADLLAPGTAVTATATEGSTFSGTVATFTNTGYATNPASDFTAAINWGDGSSSAGTVSLAGGTLTVKGSHVYSATGTETASVVLTDDAPGTANATATATIAVVTSAGVATITPVGSVNITATENTTFSSTAVANFTDTDATAVAGDFTATINWGDGTSSTGAVTGSAGAFTVGGNHLYADELAASTATVVLAQTTPSTATGTSTGTANVVDADLLAPGTAVTATAAAGATFSGTVATFINAGYPTNPASDFTAAINWGDGSTSAGTVSLTSGTLTVKGSHVYSTAGTETATVVLADDAPGTASETATATITVATSTGVATITPVGPVAISATEGTTFSSTAVATFTDTDASAVAGDFTATINWGDGTSSTGSVTSSAGTFTVGGSHLYADELAAGTATVVLTQTTPTTATGTATGTAGAVDADVLAPGTPVTATATAGATFSGTVATFTNGGYPANPASDFTAAINWGDGSSSAGTVSLAGGTLTVKGSHVYSATGTETASVVLTDDAPGTATATATVTVASSSVTITPVGPVTISATEGTTFSSTALATFTDTDATAVASDFTAAINWGDGTSSTGAVTGSAGAFTVGGSHLYADELAAGTATVVLTQTTPTTATGTATGTAGAVDADVLAPGTSITITATAGATFSGTAATFTNSGYANNPASDFTAAIKWGDSTTSAGTVSLASGTLTVKGSHVYSTAGTETATIVLTDDAPGTASETATATLTVVSAPALPVLKITKSGTPATIAVGGNETYTVTISNNGNATATNTAFTDVLPAGETFVSAVDSLGGSVTNTNGTLTETIGSFSAGASDTITIIATVGSSLAGSSVTNTASVSATNFNSGAAITSPFTIFVTGAHITTGIGYLAGVPGDGTAQTFVTNLYRELLGRNPEPAGLASWTNYVNQHNNAAGQAQAVQAFLNSPEYAVHYITSVYEIFLGRAPDAGGLQYWSAKMGQPGTPGGHSGAADEKFILSAFLGSDEFYLDAGNTPQGWINALYEDLLGRVPDGSGMAFWTNELATRGAADRDGIVRDLLTTPEAAHDLLDSFYSDAGGTASTPLAAPGTPAGTGSTKLAQLTGDGWENLYLQGPFDSAPQGNDAFFAALASGAQWDDVQLELLETSQYFTNPNRPHTD